MYLSSPGLSPIVDQTNNSNDDDDNYSHDDFDDNNNNNNNNEYDNRISKDVDKVKTKIIDSIVVLKTQ